MKKRKSIRKPAWFIVFAIVLVIGYGGIKFGQGLYHVWRLSSRLAEEERMLDDALVRISELEREIDRLTNDLHYIEKIAREEYGMIKDGEEVYRISNPDTEAKD